MSHPSPIATGLAGRCPRCGRGKLFAGFLTLAPRCAACDLDFAFADAADAPAVFGILIVGALVVAPALYVEFAYTPPLWLQGAIWIPAAIGLSLALLRPLKGLAVAVQWASRAEEGRPEK